MSYPHSWETVTIGDSLDLINGRAFKPTEWTRSGRPIIRIQNLNKQDAPYNFYEGELPEKFSVATGDLLFAWSGTPGTSFGAHVWNGQEAWLNQHIFKVVFPKTAFDRTFLRLAINQNLTQYIGVAHGGAGLAHITKGKFEASMLPVPPLNEQKRIVEKIEELFSELDAGEESLRRARRQLGVYRQSLLKQAFEGKLTAKWREEHPELLETPEQLIERVRSDREAEYQKQLIEWNGGLQNRKSSGKKLTKPSEPKAPTLLSADVLAELPVLPSSWAWIPFEVMCDVVRGGSPRPAGDVRYYDGEIPFLKVADLTRVDGPYVDRFTSTIKEAGLQKTRFVEPPVLMISNSGATLGVPRICRIAATFNDGVAAFLNLNRESHLYFYYFWTSKTEALRNIDQGAAQPNLNTDLLKSYPVPLPSLPEQQEIVRLLDEQFSVIEENEREIDAALKRSEALRQSILKKAFTGQLVPQDPSDEPASVLLERIRAEWGKATESCKKRAATKIRP